MARLAPGGQLSQGPEGATGKQGPAGQIELVTCKKGKTHKGKRKKQKCTTKLGSGTVTFKVTGRTVHVSIYRNGRLYASGVARRVHGHWQLWVNRK